jgi:hypothetical protein
MLKSAVLSLVDLGENARITFFISVPENPVNVFDRSEAAISLALPR